MTEITIHGRGGQGGVTLAKLIATAYFLRDQHVQAFEAVATAKLPGAMKQPAAAATSPRIASLLDDGPSAAPRIRTGSWATRQPDRHQLTPPCNHVCPAGNDVRGFIEATAHTNYNVRPDETPLQYYLERQRRYQAAGVDPEHTRRSIEEQWRVLDATASTFPAPVDPWTENDMIHPDRVDPARRTPILEGASS